MNISVMKCQLIKEREIEYGEICCSKDAVNLLRMLGLQNEAEETFWVLCFATNGRCIGVHEVSRGQLGIAPVHPREVFKRVILNNAASIIIAHNHPSGNKFPSNSDRQVNEVIKSAGEILGIKILDSIIIAGDEHYSFQAEEDAF